MGCLSGWVGGECEGGGTIFLGVLCLCPPLTNECDV